MSFFFNTPSLQYSRAETSKNFWQPLNYLFIDHGFVIINLQPFKSKDENLVGVMPITTQRDGNSPPAFRSAAQSSKTEIWAVV